MTRGACCERGLKGPGKEEGEGRVWDDRGPRIDYQVDIKKKRSVKARVCINRSDADSRRCPSLATGVSVLKEDEEEEDEGQESTSLFPQHRRGSIS